MKFFESRIPKIVLLSVSYNIYSGINKEKCSRIQEYLRLRTRQIHIKEVPWGIFLISLFFFLIISLEELTIRFRRIFQPGTTSHAILPT